MFNYVAINTLRMHQMSKNTFYELVRNYATTSRMIAFDFKERSRLSLKLHRKQGDLLFFFNS